MSGEGFYQNHMQNGDILFGHSNKRFFTTCISTDVLIHVVKKYEIGLYALSQTKVKPIKSTFFL